VAIKTAKNLPLLGRCVREKIKNVKKIASKKSITFEISPCNTKTKTFNEKLSVPFERGHFSGIGTQFIALETQRLRNGTIAIGECEIRQFSISRHFCPPVARQPKRFGQNRPGKVL
jgi:hypothetical protein